MVRVGTLFVPIEFKVITEHLVLAVVTKNHSLVLSAIFRSYEKSVRRAHFGRAKMAREHIGLWMVHIGAFLVAAEEAVS